MRTRIAFVLLALSLIGRGQAQTEKGGRGGTGGGGVLQYIKSQQRKGGELDREAANWCAEFQQAALEGLRITELLRDAHFSFYSQNRTIESLRIVITDDKIAETRVMLTNLCETGHFKIDRTIKDDDGDPLMARNYANGELRFNPDEWPREVILRRFNYARPDGEPLSVEDQDAFVSNVRRMIASHEGWSTGKTPIECDGHYAVSSLILDLHLGANRCAAVKQRIWEAFNKRFAGLRVEAAGISATGPVIPVRAKVEELASDAHLVEEVYGPFVAYVDTESLDSKVTLREFDEYLALLKQRENNLPSGSVVVNP